MSTVRCRAEQAILADVKILTLREGLIPGFVLLDGNINNLHSQSTKLMMKGLFFTRAKRLKASIFKELKDGSRSKDTYRRYYRHDRGRESQ
jgi:hypothetical protein